MSEESEIVYVSKRGGSGDKVYHTKPDDCLRAANAKDMSERRLEIMKAWGWEMCSYCAEEHPLIDDGIHPETDIRSESVRYQIEDGVYNDEE